MFINWQQKQLNLKIVYYGPALSGKTTNIEQVYARIDPQKRSELVSLKTSDDRTLFFDFMQFELGKIGGLTPNIQLYTVPGQTYYEVSRKLVLRGADGVVFVADSDADRIEDNLVSWRNMNAHMESLGIPKDELAVVIQINKRDLPNAVPTQVLQEKLGSEKYPTYEAVARTGAGVYDTLKAIINGVVMHVQSEIR